MDVDVVLPVLNEESAIAWVLGRMPDGYRAIVADNGSTDRSAEIARAAGALVVHEPRPGFGAACFAGLQAASADIVCFMDCDGSLDPADLPSVVAPVASGKADLMIGTRASARGAMSPHARAGNAVLCRILRTRTGVRINDIGPMRAARREALLALHIQDRRFGWPLEMIVRASEQGWNIAETRVPYSARSGRSKVTGTVRGTVRAVRDMSLVIRAIPRHP